MTEPQTFPQYFLAAAKNYGAAKIAMRKKTLGIWKPSSWTEPLEQVRAFALGITALGLQRADKVCISGDNDPAFYWTEIAVQRRRAALRRHPRSAV